IRNPEGGNGGLGFHARYSLRISSAMAWMALTISATWARWVSTSSHGHGKATASESSTHTTSHGRMGRRICFISDLLSAEPKRGPRLYHAGPVHVVEKQSSQRQGGQKRVRQRSGRSGS